VSGDPWLGVNNALNGKITPLPLEERCQSPGRSLLPIPELKQGETGDCEDPAVTAMPPPREHEEPDSEKNHNNPA